MHDALATFSEHDEVVLWFEQDLFCQVHLTYLLNWFASRGLGYTRLTLICVDEFPGVQIFHGLGQLNENQLLSLFPQRRETTKQQLELASTAWQAYCAGIGDNSFFIWQWVNLGIIERTRYATTT